MKNVFIVISMLLAASFAHSAEQGNHARGIVGFSSGELNVGLDYENRNNGIGYGGYFFFSGDNEDNNKVEVLALGAMASVSLLHNDRVHVYVAPGFGIAMIEEPAPGGDDETTFGPSIKTGVEFPINNKASLGLQHFFVYNWMADEVAESFSFLNAAVTFQF